MFAYVGVGTALEKSSDLKGFLLHASDDDIIIEFL